ncbi:uncharacterized protein DNG_07804 [Cephalotrichum gorgonifer]|uniref:Uncharacterized protein n=1 Tax=Cephalotrichum gorgonifer TaxID=2041049 RepID=A0AAE8N3Z7_9PEZI|nr:uncharacterized protein DNG_07804 [Cephalotrichum gorgonifer]
MQSHLQTPVDDGGSEPIAEGQRADGHLLQPQPPPPQQPQPQPQWQHNLSPGVSVTASGGCATLPLDLHDGDGQDNDNDTAAEENKDFFSACSCSSAPLSSSSACSISSLSASASASGLSHSLSVLASTSTPLSMEGSDSYYLDNVESGSAGAREGEGDKAPPGPRKLGRPPTPFDAMAGFPLPHYQSEMTLDRVVTSPLRNALNPDLGLDESGPGLDPNGDDKDKDKDHHDNARISQNPPLSVALPHLIPPPPPQPPQPPSPPVSEPDTVPKPEHVPEQHEDEHKPQDMPAPPRNEKSPRDETSLTCVCARKCDDTAQNAQPESSAAKQERCSCSSRVSVVVCQQPNREGTPQLQEGQGQGQGHSPQQQTGPDSDCCPSDPLKHSNTSSTSGPHAPEHDSHRTLIDPSASAPNSGNIGNAAVAALTQETNSNTNPTATSSSNTSTGTGAGTGTGTGTSTGASNPNPNSQNSSQTITASRDPPLSSLIPPSSHPSTSASSSSPSSPSPSPAPSLPRSVSNSAPIRIEHPIPEINPKTGAFLGNIAQLEATAERLSSATTSIDDAIRDLHAELKRSDSQRSAAAFARAGIQPWERELDDSDPASRLGRSGLFRRLSASAALARHSTYSGRPTAPATTAAAATNRPARYRLRSGSLNAVAQTRADMEPYMSRTGPGKGSVRSVRSGKLSLAEIVESQPLRLTQAALDAADRSNLAEEDDDTIRPQAGQDRTPRRESFTPNTDAFHAMMNPTGVQTGRDLGYDHPPQRPVHLVAAAGDQQRPSTSASNASSTHLNAAFRDFDGVHFDPEANSTSPPMSPPSQPSLQRPQALMHDELHFSSPHQEHLDLDFNSHHQEPLDLAFTSPHPGPSDLPYTPPHQDTPDRPYAAPHPAPVASPPMPRPTSYLNPETGQEMLFYPARVPAMLSLPPKLSKKPKAAARNQRQSHVLSTMPEIARQSGASWLPDPLGGHAETSLSQPMSLSDAFADMTGETPRPESAHNGSAPEGGASRGDAPEETNALGPNHGAPEIQVTPTSAEQNIDDGEVQPAVPRPLKDGDVDRGTGVDVRKSRMSRPMSSLPPQLRASAFFDLPSTSTQLKVKDGSAMATLDHLLDASTHAPVSAFTDHLVAGKLGSEVYGAEKKRSPSPRAQPVSQPPTPAVPEKKKRASFFHRLKKSEDKGRKNDQNESATPESGSSSGVDDEALPPGAVGYATLSPDTDEFDDNHVGSDDGKDSDCTGEENGEEEGEEYHGPPTTLLAELLIRKQQQKNRTKPLYQTFPNGMHSTLLELDAVAEAQRKTRKGRRVNLAWEERDPMLDDGESEDEDVPLGVLFAAAADLNRPVGLMERREMEENEPLSQRKARLQGQDTGHNINRRTLMLNPATRMSANRLSQMPPFGGVPNHQRQPSSGGAEQEEDKDDEIEGETLGERMRRLKKQEEESLPTARPVSAAFSAELLSQFGDLEDEKNDEEEAKKGGDGEGEGEEEETLGQRRRRLQAEREGNKQQPPRPAVAKRLSLADILSAHPVRDTATYEQERRAQARRAQEEMLVVKKAQEEKLAAKKAQMSRAMTGPGSGTGTGSGSGGFKNGRFNDGAAGGWSVGQGSAAASPVMGSYVAGQYPVTASPYGAVQYPVAASPYMAGQYPVAAGQYYAAGQYGMAGQAQYGGGMAPQQGWYAQQHMGMPMNPDGRTDMIDQWRYGVRQ